MSIESKDFAPVAAIDRQHSRRGMVPMQSAMFQARMDELVQQADAGIPGPFYVPENDDTLQAQ